MATIVAVTARTEHLETMHRQTISDSTPPFDDASNTIISVSLLSPFRLGKDAGRFLGCMCCSECTGDGVLLLRAGVGVTVLLLLLCCLCCVVGDEERVATNGDKERSSARPRPLLCCVD